jgi:hypothetical protein
VSFALAALLLGTQGEGTVRTASFDRDPGWEGRNNRVSEAPRTIRQDFGYSRTSHAGGGAGEIGGFISPSAEPASFARAIARRTLETPLAASGVLAVGRRGADEGSGNTLLGFFNSETLNEWRTPNTLVLRVNGRGDHFHAHLEYATRKWRAGGDFIGAPDPASGKRVLLDLPAGGTAHRWSLGYDPAGNGGGGTATLTVGDRKAVLDLDPGHKADGATFNRFGLLNVMKSADTGGSLWIDDLTVNGETDRFEADPGWEGRDNRRTFATHDVRPRFNFGYSETRFAGGRAAGEIGGLVFRGDCRYPARMASYGDRLNLLTLERPLKASGRISLRRGVTDSTTLIGFFHSAESMAANPSQASGLPRCFLGAAVEGPSREGFQFYPIYRVDGDGQGDAAVADRPHLLPDGSAHDWTLSYSPDGAGGRGRITVTLDGKAASLDLGDGHRVRGARFDRFGLVTTWIDGNGQLVYLDDLAYTAAQGDQ